MSLRDHLQDIYDQHGHLTVDLVVEAARPKNSPLHRAVFGKSVKDAAEAWYRHQAHELIQSFTISYRDAGENEPTGLRQFHAVRDGNSTVYRSATDIASDPTATALLLKDMEREWQALHRRYSTFVEFAAMVRRDMGEAA